MTDFTWVTRGGFQPWWEWLHNLRLRIWPVHERTRQPLHVGRHGEPVGGAPRWKRHRWLRATMRTRRSRFGRLNHWRPAWSLVRGRFHPTDLRKASLQSRIGEEKRVALRSIGCVTWTRRKLKRRGRSAEWYLASSPPLHFWWEVSSSSTERAGMSNSQGTSQRFHESCMLTIWSPVLHAVWTRREKWRATPFPLLPLPLRRLFHFIFRPCEDMRSWTFNCTDYNITLELNRN